MDVFVPKLTSCHMFSALPFVYWRSTSLLLFPVLIYKESLMAIRLFSDSYILLVSAVKFALRILRMVNPSHPMWMPFGY